MNLLLVALRIRTEENDSGVFSILQCCLVLNVLVPINTL
jgi:hypothetical protein